MRAPLLFFAAVLLAAGGPQESIQKILARVSEEAEIFRLMAPKVLAQETLIQRARKPPRRFHPRIGNAALEPPKPEYRTRQIVSEYGFSTFKDSPNVLHELRQVVSVDGRQVATQDKARRTLTIGVTSDDDRLKKRMLESFEKHGLRGAAADFGQVLLLFTRRRLEDYSFHLAGEGRIGADPANILEFQQRGGSASLLIFEKRKALREPLQGQLWVRQSDSLPLRIVLNSTRKEDKTVVRDEATIDYVMSPHGLLTPASVVHRQYAGSDLVVENVFQYTSFRMFSADAEIKFTEEPAAPPPKAPPNK